MQDVTARQNEVGGRGAGRWLFDKALYLGERAVALAGIDHAIAGRIGHRHFKRADQIAAHLIISIDHLLEAAPSRRTLHEFVGQQNSEGLVPDDVARAPDRVAQAQRFLLAQEHRVTGRKARAVQG